jgi:hypothetical protein
MYNRCTSYPHSVDGFLRLPLSIDLGVFYVNAPPRPGSVDTLLVTDQPDRPRPRCRCHGQRPPAHPQSVRPDRRQHRGVVEAEEPDVDCQSGVREHLADVRPQVTRSTIGPLRLVTHRTAARASSSKKGPLVGSLPRGTSSHQIRRLDPSCGARAYRDAAPGPRDTGTALRDGTRGRRQPGTRRRPTPGRPRRRLHRAPRLGPAPLRRPHGSTPLAQQIAQFLDR